MSHQSRLGKINFDCHDMSAREGARFWGAALGARVEKSGKAISVLAAQGGLVVEVQRVDHDSRVHVDIETDDIPAEVARLIRLGARPVQDFDGWTVMEAPTGHRFCVIPAQTPDFATRATTWEDGA